MLYDLIPMVPETQATSVDAAFLSDADGPAALHRRFRGGLKNEGNG